MGDKLKADVGRIRETGGALGHIRTELLGASEIVDGSAAAIGDKRLSDTLHEFATNWDAHRQRICEDLDTFGTWTLACADAYDETEDQLTKALQQSPGEG